MNIWVLGAGGMLGSCFVELCGKMGIPVVGSPRSDVDVTDLEGLKRRGKQLFPTHIVNCAAYTNVDSAESEKEQAFAINATGAGNAALVARNLGARLVHVSTDYVFDGKGKRPYREEDVCAPINTYGQSKWEGEKAVLATYPQACIVRTSWLFGGKGKNFISSVLNRILCEEEITAVSDQCGKPTYCRHVARALVDLLDCSGIVHFASSTPCSRYQMAQDIVAEARRRGLPVKCARILSAESSAFPTPAPRPGYSVLGTEKYESLFNRRPPTWQAALTDFFDDEQ
ncbi:MAG: dTDP-4-dehydrorhamnose reductase [Chlamydiota bacterium]